MTEHGTIPALMLAALTAFGAPHNAARLDTSARYDTIENFDDGVVALFSYPGEDLDPDAWALDSVITHNNSAYSLKLWGNTWKVESIPPLPLDSHDVWQVAAYIDTLAEIQGFGLMDSANLIRYSLAGTEQVDPENWIPVYQGAFPMRQWNEYQLPVGQDWLARHGYLPLITAILFINDRDSDPDGVVYFDDILDITADLPMAPQVTIGYSRGEIYQDVRGVKLVDIQFYSTVVDTDSWDHDYFWHFGDGSTGGEPDPCHTYVVLDDHQYTVLLEIVDSTNQWGRATCQVPVDPGPTTYPLTMNFVGDIMLARRYEQPGGIIPTLGVEAIFEPTLAHLGQTAEITVANLEGPLTDTGTPHPTKPIIFRSAPANVAGLAYAGIDVVSLANNHIIDYGLEGMRQTQAVLDSHNIIHSGAGANSYEAYQPVFVDRKGTNIAFLASSERTGQYDNYQPYLNAGFNKPGFAYLTQFDITRQIEAVENDADIIIVEMHSGDEYNPLPEAAHAYGEVDDEEEMYSRFLIAPSRSDIADRHHAIDEGADLVVCHHVHVLQGFEVYNGKLIAHSLGNFTFDLNYPETYPSVILSGKIDAFGFYEHRVAPVYLDDYIPRPARGELGRHILDYLTRRSRDLGTYLIADEDSVTARVILDTLGLTSTTTLHTDTVHLREENGSWISNPLRLAGAGDISAIVSIAPQADWHFRLGREALWFGNFENEGSTMWLLDHPDEFYDDSVFYAGARSLGQFRAQQSALITTNLQNRLPCAADTTGYTLYGRVRTDNGHSVEMRINFYQWRTVGFPIGSASTEPLSGTNEWTFCYQDFSPASGTNFLDIHLRSEGPLSGDGYAWFDNVGLIEWESWQLFDPGLLITTPYDYAWIQVRAPGQIDEATLSYEMKQYDPGTALSSTGAPSAIAASFRSYPNPAPSAVTFQYALAAPGEVTMRIYNVLGQEVKTLLDERQAVGQRTVVWDGRDNHRRALSAGVYFAHLVAGAQAQTVKLILLR